MRLRIKFFIFSIIMPVVMAFATAVQAQSVFDYPRKSDFVVIEYGLAHAMLNDEDKTPLLRIFGDGRVLVHFPVYMKRAGDYEMKITDAQLQKLLQQLEENSVMSFDANSLSEKVGLAKARQVQSDGVVSFRTDDTSSIIKVRLETYIPSASGVAKNGFRKTVKWVNLDWQARKFPGVSELTGIAAAEKRLQAFTKDKGLSRIR